MAEGPDRWVETYVRKAGLAPRLSRDEAAALTRRIHGGDAEAKESLVTASRRLVVMAARKFVHAIPHEGDWDTRSSPSPDSDQLAALFRKGEEGLMTAIARFDESKGFSFPTYAIWWIQQAIIAGDEGGEPAGVREPRSPAPQAPAQEARLDLRQTGG